MLDSLAELSMSEAKALLMTLPGVGPKTAACVLLFACERPALPVDTHVYRVSKRLTLIEPGVNPEQSHDRLERLLKPDDVHSFHVNMIAYGRTVCGPRNPRCADCPLALLCRFAQAQGRKGEHSSHDSSSEQRDQYAD
jgi:endonuclease III